ncbi:putative N-acetyltransferase HLS1-like [Dichanthelium oligosanthes]|uniref:Putative N-acetyltransferase HLS1-like n=1 Tax=Dichanthelium oligosanthes TaxID=888268 RepID=A0A1E5UJR4_9POAL|nr:putative N-acetyltransferase HLS1-like [Dichanthelium oligosanthes]
MVKVAAEEDGGAAVVVREFHEDRDRAAVERLECACEVGPSGGKLCLFTDLLGDPLCRVRHSPAYLMLVAEASGGPLGGAAEVVGVVRGCVKTVACGRGKLFSKVAYLLGLRVSPGHRRRGIGRRLVERMEEWFRQMGAEYAYVATDRDNEPSVLLFTQRCGYAKFRTPSVLVHPVFRHDLSPSRSGRVAVVELAPREAELLYRERFADVEFFPRDIHAVLSNPLSLGTFLAVPGSAARSWRGVEAFLAAPPGSWAVASVWNCKDAFRLEVRGAPRLWRAAARATRAADRALSPWLLRVPSVPNLFEPFGMHFLYGLGGAGGDAPRMARALCRHAHNLARRAGARVVATEVGACDPLRAGVPHWPKLGAEDLWCMKRLADGYGGGALGDWTKAPPGASIFVDPREF